MYVTQIHYDTFDLILAEKAPFLVKTMIFHFSQNLLFWLFSEGGGDIEVPIQVLQYI